MGPHVDKIVVFLYTAGLWGSVPHPTHRYQVLWIIKSMAGGPQYTSRCNWKWFLVASEVLCNGLGGYGNAQILSPQIRRACCTQETS